MIKYLAIICTIAIASCGVITLTPDQKMDSWGTYYEGRNQAIGEESRVDRGKKDGELIQLGDLTVVITDKGWGVLKYGPGWVTQLDEESARRLLRKAL